MNCRYGAFAKIKFIESAEADMVYEVNTRKPMPLGVGQMAYQTP